MPRAKTRKRPCAICRRWFIPNARQIGRQKTCGKPACQREQHRRQCQQWNRKNKRYFKAIYLSEKIERTKDPPDRSQESSPPVIPVSRTDLVLPKDVIVKTTGTDLLIVLDYIIEQIVHRKPKISAFEPP
ncbi:hypothetical protein D1AOALGA4SA_8389 [Olavius algarvensis Delta 1 endosymbiont]|nr:hypothetical protein D1AOALGA4SA_8389 [Olavius algarvensis Delta 1 endosymbiont]